MIACGHRPAELPHYTRRQLQLYFEQAQRLAEAEQATLMMGILGAFSKNAKQLLRKLLRE